MDENGDIHTWKKPDPAWKAVASPEFHNWCDRSLTDKARILLVHTRAYTKGSPHNNENNHPLFAKNIEGVIIHNGTARNDDNLFEINKKLHGFERSCATDSDIFRAILDSHKRIDKALIGQMGIVQGTAAVAAIHKNSPGKLLLLRDNNPLVIGATADTIVFASNKETIHKVIKPWIKLHNMPMQVHAPDLSFMAMHNESGYIYDLNANPPGLVAHDVFKCNGSGGYIKYVKNTEYWNRQARAAAAAKTEKRYSLPSTNVHNAASNPTSKGTKVLVNELPANAVPPLNNPRLFEFTICPNGKCSKHVELSEANRLLANLALLACKSCGTNLTGGQDASMPVN